MDNEEKKKKSTKKLEESKYDKNPPIEILESDGSRPATTPDVEGRDEELEKFKSGEMGAEQFRYNDDGSPVGTSRKLDIDTNADPK